MRSWAGRSPRGVAHPADGLGLVADQRVGDRGEHRAHIETAASAIVGPGQRSKAIASGSARNGSVVQEARPRRATPEGQVVARVVGEVAEAHARDRERLRAAAAAVQRERAERPHHQYGGEREQAAGVTQQRGPDAQAGSGDPEEALVLLGHVGVSDVGERVEGGEVVERERHRPPRRSPPRRRPRGAAPPRGVSASRRESR